MKTLFFLLAFTLMTTIAFATPTEADRQEALSLIYTVSNGQNQTFEETSNYQSVTARMVGSFVISSCAYSNLEGKGYISTVSKVDEGRVFIIQRHEGDADPILHTSWTCMNCSGETYDMFDRVNEHGLCSIKEN